MASTTVLNTPFPSGAAVSVYGRNGGQPLETPTVPGQPLVASATADASGRVAVTGLQPAQKYWAVGQDSAGAWRWVSFRTDAGWEETLSPADAIRRVRSDSPVDVRDFDVDLLGNHDSSGGLALAVAQSTADNRQLYIPGGEIRAAGVLLKSGTHIRGDGSRRTILKLLTDSTGQIFGTYDGSGDSIDDVTIEGLTLDGDQANSTVVGGSSLLHAYKSARWHLSRVRIMNGAGYGFAWQGYPTQIGVGKQGPEVDLYMEFVELIGNGYLRGVSTSNDGMDVKNCERAQLISVYALGNSDKGINIRGRFVTGVGCHADGNGNGWDMNSNNSPTDTDDTDSYHSLLGCSADSNVSTGFNFSSTEDSTNYAQAVGCHARKNGGNGLSCGNSSTGKVHMTVLGGSFIKNGTRGIESSNAESCRLKGAVIRDNVADGLRLTNQAKGAHIDGCDIQNNGGFGIRSTGTSDWAFVQGGAVKGNVSGAFTFVGVNDLAKDVDNDGLTALTAAATLTIQAPMGDAIIVNGNTNITSITATRRGRRVTLIFTGTPTVTDGGNLKLAGDFVATNNDTLTLSCDGTNWFEIARSVN